MALHSKTCEKLEDKELCRTVMNGIQMGFSKVYLQNKYQLTSYQIDRIIRFYGADGNCNIDVEMVGVAN